MLTTFFLRSLFFLRRNELFLATRASWPIIVSSSNVDVELLKGARDSLQNKAKQK